MLGIETDPLSLLFIGCIVLALAFLVVTTLLGGVHGHATGHVTSHVTGHVDVAHAATAHAVHAAGNGAQATHAVAGAHPTHLTVHDAAHDGAHDATGQGHSASSTVVASLWQSLGSTLQASFNLYGLLMFLLGFGLLGYLLHTGTHATLPVALVFAAGFGIACAVLVSLALTRLFVSSAVSVLTAETSRPEGRMGQITHDLHAGGVGEVVFARPGGGRQSLSARSADGLPLTAGDEVVILAVRDGIASVQSWDAFILSMRAGRAPALEAFEAFEP